MNSENTLSWRNFLLRAIVTILALGIWFWTQSLIGARSLPVTGIGDAIHQWTAPLNAYFFENTREANALLIVSSGLIDGLGIFLLARWLFGKSIRPFLGLLILLGLRQIMQAICVLPAPPHSVWHYPGVPSLLVTYGVTTDYFFSGHTAIAVLGATELAQFEKQWLTLLGIAIVSFEVSTVLILRAHYTMDVFTGIIAALWVAQLCKRIAPPLDALISKKG
jgi:membrane-associated phospholipid phosphatase